MESGRDTYEKLKIELGGNMLAEYERHNISPPKKRVQHTHHHLEMSFIKAGSGYYYVEDRTYHVKEGDIFIFNNIEAHGLHAVGTETLVNMVIHFEPRLIWSNPGDLFNNRYLGIFYNRPDHFSNQIPEGHPINEELTELMCSIEDEFLQQKPEYALMVKVKILNALVLLLRHFGESTNKNTTELKTHQRQAIEKIIHYMHHHYMDTIKLDDLASLVYMNPSYFSRFFKKFNGLSPIDYLARVRIQESVHMLQNTDLTILEIAYRCGFNNATNFNKTFRKVNGCNPSEYRQKR